MNIYLFLIIIINMEFLQIKQINDCKQQETVLEILCKFNICIGHTA